jgi:lipoprotein signal peptidase
VADQASKVWAERADVGVVHNRAAAMGVVDASTPVLVIAALAALAAFAAVVVPLALRVGVALWVPGLVLGGAAANLVDRLRLDGVRDFIATPWGIFNLADLAILVGVAVVASLTGRRLLSPAVRRG